jgi:hypothetical protein
MPKELPAKSALLKISTAGSVGGCCYGFGLGVVVRLGNLC